MSKFSYAEYNILKTALRNFVGQKSEQLRSFSFNELCAPADNPNLIFDVTIMANVPIQYAREIVEANKLLSKIENLANSSLCEEALEITRKTEEISLPNTGYEEEPEEDEDEEYEDGEEDPPGSYYGPCKGPITEYP